MIVFTYRKDKKSKHVRKVVVKYLFNPLTPNDPIVVVPRS